jgi:NADH:ubiquinone oxidoreductase subunit E
MLPRIRRVKMMKLNVCIGSSCHLKGSYNVIQVFQQMIEENSLHDKIDFNATFCAKQCQNPGVTVSIDGDKYNIVPETAREFFKNKVIPFI